MGVRPSKRATAAALLPLAVVVACGDDGAETSVSDAIAWDPTLRASAGAGTPVCAGEEGADVAVTGTLVSTCGAAPTTITASIDGGPASEVGRLAPGAFAHDGHLRTAHYAVTVPLTNGAHTVTLCFTLPGYGSPTGRYTCAPPQAVEVSCASACGAPRAFGAIVSNHDLCRGHGPPHVPVHVRGDFGEGATLAIEGPGGFRTAGYLRRAGESCNYHYNWSTRANHGGAGAYAFHVTGHNGRSYVFAATLHCR